MKQRFTIMIEPKLLAQLQKYADRDDEGIVSVSARKAIRKFIEEQSIIDSLRIKSAERL